MIKRRTLRNAVIAAIVLVVGLVVIWSAVNLLGQRAEQAHQAAEAEVEAAADAIGQRVSQAIREYAERLDRLAESEEIRSLFADGDQAALSAAADRHLDQFDAGLKLRLIRPGEAALEPDARPPLSYASLDLLGQAERSPDPIPAELLMPGTELAHVVMVARSMGEDGELAGLLHLSLRPDVIERSLDVIGNTGDYFELRQFVGDGSPVIIASGGNAALQDRSMPTTVPIPEANWSLAYWPDDGAVDVRSETAGTGATMAWALPAVALMLVIAYMAYRRRGGANLAADDDLVTYDGAVRAIMEGAHPGLDKLVPNLPRISQPKQVVDEDDGGVTSENPVVPPEDADITHVAIPMQQPAPASGAKQQSEAKPAAAAANDQGNSGTTEQPVNSQAKQEQKQKQDEQAIDPGIFRAYDIRGVVATQLTPAVVRDLGRAIGSEARDRGEAGIIVGRDGRTSSPELAEALIEGLRATGVEVIDIGLVPTPLLYFATHHLEFDSGVTVTGSHNGPEYNGLKIVIAGETLSGDTVQALYKRIQTGDYQSGNGSYRSADIKADYIRRITEDIPVALGSAFKLVVDSGNGAVGNLASQIYRALGHDVSELYCDIDGAFPNHHPDPGQPDNLKDLIAMVQETGADLGLAFDGDGDRLGVVDSRGTIIWPDRQLMLLARDVLSRNPGAQIIFDVKCSRHLKEVIEQAGGSPLMWKTGHSLIKNKMKEVDAPLAGEMSGHIFFKERWYGFDDAIYTGARMLQVLSQHKENPTEVLAELPGGMATPELRIKLAEKYHAKAMQALSNKLDTEGGELTDIDGLRLELSDGWGLVRPSNTSPCLIARFEADNEDALARIQARFRDALIAVSPALKPPF